MFAGGTGIAPFRGFWQARSQARAAGETWLFFSKSTRDHFYYRGELVRLP
jgi:sulfite reductase alpha subunit-like flavoprotein